MLKLKNPQEIKWKDDVVDNEHAGKKKSKICCIYQGKGWVKDSSSDSEDDRNAYEKPPKKCCKH